MARVVLSLRFIAVERKNPEIQSRDSKAGEANDNQTESPAVHSRSDDRDHELFHEFRCLCPDGSGSGAR